MSKRFFRCYVFISYVLYRSNSKRENIDPKKRKNEYIYSRYFYIKGDSKEIKTKQTHTMTLGSMENCVYIYRIIRE